jgi:type II secretory pathway component GspD/PulD (secretin)
MRSSVSHADEDNRQGGTATTVRNPETTFQTDGGHRRSHTAKRLFAALVVGASVVLHGCHGWPDEREMALETERIFDETTRIESVPDAAEPWPSAYTRPPLKTMQTVGGAEEWRLVYFCRYHTAEQLKQIIHEQFATRLFDQSGQDTTLRDYAITAESVTNQLLVRCPAEQDVDAILEMLNETDVPPIQVQIDCIVSEVSASMTMDRETTLLIENLFGEQIRLGGKEDASGGLLPAFPGASLRDPARDKFGLKIGISRPLAGHQVQLLIDLLMSRGYLKVLMNPSLQVLNGQTAKIQSKQQVPLQSILVQTGGFGEDTVLQTQTEYYDVIDSLEVTPQVFADGSVSLETRVQIASYLGPQGVTQMPSVSERILTSGNSRIRLGQSLIVGGFRRTEKRDVIRGVPVLKDIPVLSLLFSGRDAQEQVMEVIMIVTPTLSTKGRPPQNVADMIEYRHTSPMGQTMGETMTDPLGVRAREQERQRRIDAGRAIRAEGLSEEPGLDPDGHGDQP